MKPALVVSVLASAAVLAACSHGAPSEKPAEPSASTGASASSTAPASTSTAPGESSSGASPEAGAVASDQTPTAPPETPDQQPADAGQAQPTNPIGAEATDASAPAPQILAPAQLGGRTITLAAGEYLVITDAEGIDATIENPAIAVFSPAYEQDGTAYNAGIGGLEPGTTKVELSDGTAFTVTVR